MQHHLNEGSSGFSRHYALGEEGKLILQQRFYSHPGAEGAWLQTGFLCIETGSRRQAEMKGERTGIEIVVNFSLQGIWKIRFYSEPSKYSGSIWISIIYCSWTDGNCHVGKNEKDSKWSGTTYENGFYGLRRTTLATGHSSLSPLKNLAGRYYRNRSSFLR